MTTTFGTAGRTRRDQPIAVCALVAAVVVAGYLAYTRLLIRVIPSLFSDWPHDYVGVLRFILILSPYVLFGVVLLVWGRSRRQRLAGAACAVLAGLVDWGLAQVSQKLYEHDALTASRVQAIEWTLVLLVPALVSLAWGLARRSGRAWLVGVLVAPLLAGLHYYLRLHSTGFGSWEAAHGQWWVGRLEFVAPMVIACVACWLIELGWPAPHPEIESSA